MLTTEQALEGPRFRAVVMALAQDLDPGLVQVTTSIRSGVGATFARLGTFPVPDDLIADLVGRLGRLRTGSIARRTDPLGLFPALGEAVDTSMPWQPPFVEQAVTGIPEVRAALRPLAEAVLASPAAAWWAPTSTGTRSG